ncbi:hypothetical protein FDA38_10965 [Kribbella jiaozuonensis]|uniref:Uncharacterized protein n=1 Tax=Kribbella jiaozuonensis TaxID=2575441 RepID=A0A4U3M7U8_9ACTN|nr:hypothetical protein FDA38_12010 [Kribbella jiaozuonensis]TKK83556.1 hypothetical protein FDA38_10965 [Kribbella jiaozuonensis]
MAADTTAAAACKLESGSVTAGGDHTHRVITAGSPATVQEKQRYTALFPEGRPRLSSLFFNDPVVPGFGGAYAGHVVIGSGLYSSTYFLTTAGEVDRTQSHNFRIGGGWADATFLETSYPHDTNPFALANHYALRGNGTLTRWDSKGGFGWTNPQSAGGFAAVKTMALISQAATYDTFLANTHGGALYTIRLPLTSPMKPVVKRVRASTWQAFDALIAEKCGQYGTLLLGIDKDTQSGYLYAVGHANGTATVIKGLGKVPATFADPLYFRYAGEPGTAPLLFGE